MSHETEDRLTNMTGISFFCTKLCMLRFTVFIKFDYFYNRLPHERVSVI